MHIFWGLREPVGIYNPWPVTKQKCKDNYAHKEPEGDGAGRVQIKFRFRITRSNEDFYHRCLSSVVFQFMRVKSLTQHAPQDLSVDQFEVQSEITRLEFSDSGSSTRRTLSQIYRGLHPRASTYRSIGRTMYRELCLFTMWTFVGINKGRLSVRTLILLVQMISSHHKLNLVRAWWQSLMIGTSSISPFIQHFKKCHRKLTMYSSRVPPLIKGSTKFEAETISNLQINLFSPTGL